MPTFGNTVVYTTETPPAPLRPGYWDSYSELEMTYSERLAAAL